MLEAARRAAVERGALPPCDAGPIGIEPPVDPAWGELASDVAITIGRRLRRPPEAIAAVIVRHVADVRGWLASAEVGGPGFVNLRLTPAFWADQLARATAEEDAWGMPDVERPPVEVRLVLEAGAPADATGLRTALAADALARLLAAGGRRVVRLTGVGREQADVLAAFDVHADPRPLPAGATRVIVAPAGAWPGGARGGARVAIGGVVVERRGAAVARTTEALRAALPPHELRLALLGAPLGTAMLLDLEDVGTASIARMAPRIARLLARPPAPDGPGEALASAELAVVRVLAGWPDVVADALAARAPDRLVRFLDAVAAVFHGYYNRRHLVMDDSTLTPAARAMVTCVHRVRSRALALVGAGSPGEA